MSPDPVDEASVAAWFCAGLVEMGLALELAGFGTDRSHALPTGDAATATLMARMAFTTTLGQK